MQSGDDGLFGLHDRGRSSSRTHRRSERHRIQLRQIIRGRRVEGQHVIGQRIGRSRADHEPDAGRVVRRHRHLGGHRRCVVPLRAEQPGQPVLVAPDPSQQVRAVARAALAQPERRQGAFRQSATASDGAFSMVAVYRTAAAGAASGAVAPGACRHPVQPSRPRSIALRPQCRCGGTSRQARSPVPHRIDGRRLRFSPQFGPTAGADPPCAGEPATSRRS